MLMLLEARPLWNTKLKDEFQGLVYGRTSTIWLVFAALVFVFASLSASIVTTILVQFSVSTGLRFVIIFTGHRFLIIFTILLFVYLFLVSCISR
ncbi:hypothetical protein BKA65DRAFT_544420 [Rhexocercosporidium sp. MPI-PUGE-AT-0058]|nr:hypothetical protein BKA65DRAFT_544420 [Rhexocercosporidium sp. MPI-PUGE-AT-0058]